METGYALGTDFILPLAVAAVMGGLVGWERESLKKPAGLRTHMMVALGAATFTMLAMHLVVEGAASSETRGDPGRIIEGIATGIGFLGAGTIIQSRNGVRGITTAAGIWVVGGIGACCGAGEYLIAATVVVLSLIILAVLPKVESSVGNKAEPASG